MALLDAASWEARVEAESPSNADVALVWVGDEAPASAWRSYRRPLSWPEVVQAMDAMFDPQPPAGTELDLDLVVEEEEEVEPLPPAQLAGKRALIVGSAREDRLYLRARLALAQLTQADEAESGNHALQLVQATQYDVALVDYGLPDMQAMQLVRELRGGVRPIRTIGVTKADRSLPERVQAWMAGAEALLDKPPHPARLNDLLRRL